eukprot:6201588-Pleurochrysis_carterae.AAC.1
MTGSKWNCKHRLANCSPCASRKRQLWPWSRAPHAYAFGKAVRLAAPTHAYEQVEPVVCDAVCPTLQVFKLCAVRTDVTSLACRNTSQI